MLNKIGKGRPSSYSIRKDNIIRIAASLFVKTGFAKTTMREIAKACGINVGTLYYYFKSKDDILYLIIHNAVTRPEGWREHFENSCDRYGATQALKEFIKMYYSSTDETQDICLFTYQETRNLDKTSQRIILTAAEADVDVCAAILKKGIESGEFNIDNVTILSHDIIAIGHMWAVRRWYLQPRINLDQYIQEHTNLFLTKIKPVSPSNKNTVEKKHGKQNRVPVP